MNPESDLQRLSAERKGHVATVTEVTLPEFRAPSGTLTAAQFGREIPFVPSGYFSVHSVPEGAARGGHAHRLSSEFVCCLHGTFTLVVDDGHHWQAFRLTPSTPGINVMPMTWCTVVDFTPDAVLLGLLALPYDDADYIRTYDEFLQLVAARARG